LGILASDQTIPGIWVSLTTPPGRACEIKWNFENFLWNWNNDKICVKSPIFKDFGIAMALPLVIYGILLIL
jgi:hypothetical protein